MPNASDVPAGPATIRGRVLRAASETPVGGVELLLYALDPSGRAGVRHSKSAADGGFAFEQISNDPHTAYLVGARYQGISFPGERVSFGRGEFEREVVVRVSEPTRDTGVLTVQEARLQLERVGDRLRVTETYRLHNSSRRTFYVPKDRRRPARAALRALLPAGAEGFGMPFGLVPEGLEHEAERIAYFGPVYPGEQEVTFSYTVPAGAGTAELRKRFPQRAGRLALLLPEGEDFRVKAPGLHEAGSETLEGRKLRRLEGSALRAGQKLVLQIELPPARHDSDAVTLREARIFLELADGRLEAQEEYRIEVEGKTPVVARPDEALLVLPLPPSVEEIRFSPNAADFGLTRTPEGNAALHGPLPAGESEIVAAYRMPAPGGDVSLERRFTRPLPLLSVFVVDNGLLVESARLHRRRPVRSGQETYIYLEGFQIEPDQTVPLHLAALAPPRGIPVALRIGFAALVGALALALLGAPLARPGKAEVSAEPEEHEAARAERESVYAALRDLEHDFETGKLSEADYRVLRRELRARAAALLRAEEDASAATAKATPARARVARDGAPERRCTDCAAPAAGAARFCSQCGAPLETSDAREEASA